jgi:hypothetical protein
VLSEAEAKQKAILQKDSLKKTQTIKNPEKVGTTRSFFIFYLLLFLEPATRPAEKSAKTLSLGKVQHKISF